jgi:hypothetical protein
MGTLYDRSMACHIKTILTNSIKSILIKQIVYGFIQLNPSLEPNIFVEHWDQNQIFKLLEKFKTIGPNDRDPTHHALIELTDLISKYPIEQRILTIDKYTGNSFSLLVSDNFIVRILIMMEITIQDLMYGLSLYHLVCGYSIELKLCDWNGSNSIHFIYQYQFNPDLIRWY